MVAGRSRTSKDRLGWPTVRLKVTHRSPIGCPQVAVFSAQKMQGSAAIVLCFGLEKSVSERSKAIPSQHGRSTLLTVCLNQTRSRTVGAQAVCVSYSYNRPVCNPYVIHSFCLHNATTGKIELFN